MLLYNGTIWVNTPAVLNALVDVTITAVASGDVLQYNGALWVNTALSALTGLSEAIDDRVNALFLYGTGISASYNDGANTYTVSLDADLATIAGLTATTDSFMQAKAGAWAARTIAQVKTDLSLSGTNSGDQTITLTGDVTGSGTGSFAATVANNAVTYAKMQDVSATSRFLGRITAGSGDPEELTGTQATTLLDTFTSSLKGQVPASGGGTTNFLRADGTFADPGTSAVGASFNPDTRFDEFDDLGASFGSFWATDLAGSGGPSVTKTPIAGNPCVIRLATGTNSAGYARCIRGTSISAIQESYTSSDTYPLTLEGRIRVATLPDGTQTFSADIGMRATLNAANSNMLIGIRWDSGTAAAKWVGFTRNTAGSSTTTVSTITAPSANTWYRVKLVWRTTDVVGYVMLAGVWTVAFTITGTLPDQGMSQYISVAKSAGTTSRTADFDYTWVYQDISGGRP
jgi:hypothetical protein